MIKISITKQKSKTIKIGIITTVVFLVVAVVVAIFSVKYYYTKNYPIKYETEVQKYAQEYSLDPLLIYAFIKTESGFNKDAVSVNDARGLMQLLPSTFIWLQTKTTEKENYDESALFDPDINIKYGALFLSMLRDNYGSVRNISAGYHAGINAVRQWLQDEKYSSDGINLTKIPYSDTKKYVDKIEKNYNIYKKLYG